MEALTVFYGTTRLYQRHIARHGLRSFRESGEVYVTPVRTRALRYAQMWAVGLNAIGEMDGPHGIIVTCELSADTMLWECGTDEFSVRPVPASAVKTIEHLDFTGLPQREKTRCLLDLLAVVRWDYYRHTRDKFDLIEIELDNPVNAEMMESVRSPLDETSIDKIDRKFHETREAYRLIMRRRMQLLQKTTEENRG